LAESSAPPVRLVTLKSNGNEVKAGNEVVLFRHEKTFYNKPGIFVKVQDSQSAEQIKAAAGTADSYAVNYVGMDLTLDGFAVEDVKHDPAAFAAAVGALRQASKRPLILISRDPKVMAAGLQALSGESPLVCAADSSNWEAMADLAKQHKAALVVSAATLDELAALTEKIKAKGVEDLVLDPSSSNMGASLASNTVIRRLALKKNFRALGYPILAFPASAAAATQAVAKYAGFIVLDHFAADLVYPLLVLRQNIYTDPQKPIQVQPGLYEINNPKPQSPVLVTTNFSITYFSVANEVESSGLPAWLLVTDADGMSVLTAWAAGKFDSERIAKSVRAFNIADKIDRKRIIIPGAVAVLSGELEAELPGWEICVGPREGVDIPVYIKTVLK
jgi:acetyl-CoA decarbonylase/synthase, CODH/ACS complex subunit gamma